ncbi:hypothetical protein H8M03_11100 [Sphingomonas sabuli]|uniref:Uncharacterized protein n=1 Tax=Sphingomonas sabuli TaxID=2764186 RepID=A0A7G9L1N9_9SPHN|nr:hypothetical protein [Sphingomonas sabuli]QNM82538.1 hypothetical protein H8M03_11100 [Sphingomonas sabuli]
MPMYAESAADALARNVHILADDPHNFASLIAAGKAALQLGDAQSAAGFFGRAEEINANSPLAQAGMGAALVATGDPQGALTYFNRALQLGASVVSFGCDRGLAFDLLGKQAAAQTDYRAALNGPDRDEARRRLALSLAISGHKTQAMETLQPLVQRRDTGALRVRALALAVSGDIAAANQALNFTMPGAAARMDPFFRRLPGLTTPQKAAAVHLGIFPGDGTAVASRQLPREDRLASIEQMLTATPSVAQPPAATGYSLPVATVAERAAAPVRMASIPDTRARVESPNTDLIQTKRIQSDPNSRKIWLQLASGSNGQAFTDEFNQIRSRKPSLFKGMGGYVAETGARSRLLIGPFHSSEDAELFGDALESARIDSFAWTSQPGQVVRKIPNQ